MVFQILPNKLDYTVGEQVTIQVTADPNVTWDLNVYKSGNSTELFNQTGTGSLAFNISLIIAQNGAGDYQIAGATRYVSGYDAVVIHVTAEAGAVNTYELRIKYANLGWGTSAQLESRIISIANAINPLIMPLGYTFRNQYTHNEANKTISLFYEGSSPAIPLAAIAIAIFGILVAIGFVITSISWLKESVALETITETKEDVVKKAADSYAKGEITKEQYETILAGLTKLDIKDKPTDWTTIAIIAGVAVVAATLLPKLIGGKR